MNINYKLGKNLNKTINELSQNEKKILLTLNKLKGKGSPDEIQKKGNFNLDVEVMNAASWLQSKKLVTVEEHIKNVYSLDREGKYFLKKGLPEKRALKIITENKGKVLLDKLSKGLTKNEIPIAIGWLKKKGWATIKKENGETVLEISNKGIESIKIEEKDEKILKYLNENPNSELDKGKNRLLLSRKHVINEKDIIIIKILVTEQGKKIIEKGIKIKDEISQITSTIIKNCEWKQKNIRSYDVQAFARQTDNSFTVTDNAIHQAIFIEGRPIRYRAHAGSWVYGIVTAYAAGLVTIAGAPMTVAFDDELDFGPMNKAQQCEFHVLTNFADAAETDLLRDDVGVYFSWFLGEARLVFFAVRVIQKDTGVNQPRVNVTIGGNAVCTSNGNAGLEVDTIWVPTIVDINATNYVINRNDAFELTTDANGSNNDALDLTVSATIILV